MFASGLLANGSVPAAELAELARIAHAGVEHGVAAVLRGNHRPGSAA